MSAADCCGHVIANAGATAQPARSGRRARAWTARLLVLLLACGVRPATAFEYCVGSVAELDNALVVATAPTGQTVVIKLRQGTYHVSGSFLMHWHEYNAMQLLGGYDATCENRTLAASNTILDGDGAHMEGMRLHSHLTVEGLRFQNISGNQGGVYFNVYDGTEYAGMHVHNNEFRGIGLIVACYDCEDNSVSIANNLVYDAPAEGIAVLYGYSDTTSATLTNNTVVGSAERGIWVQIDRTPRLANNVVWNNARRDIWVDGDTDGNPGAGLYRDNLYGTHYGDEAAGSFGTLHDDPLFASAATDNYRLQNASPAVNAGSASDVIGGVDVEGHTRVVGSAPDRGAYESALDDTVPTTLTVTTTADSGAGSLRQALLDANANPDFTFVDFDIAGACPRTIALSSALPAITQGLRINAYSQPGSAANTRTKGDNGTRCIVLDGGGTIARGLDFGGAGNAQFWLQGMAIEGFTNAGLRLGGGSDALVWGNQFGGKVGTVALSANGSNIVLTAFASSASIGGDFPAQRNVIAGATSYGVSVGATGLFASHDNVISGNLIGTWGSETVADSNNVGIRLATSGNTVTNNIIVNSIVDGVQIAGGAAHDNTLQGNRIGRIDSICITVPVPFCFADSAGNLRHGVRIDGGAHANTVQSNTIWNNGQMGVSIGDASERNRLSANSIYNSGSYGIDLDGSGLNDNDTDAGQANLPNRSLNYPVITRAWGGSAKGWVEGTLDSTNGGYLIQVMSSAHPDNVPTGEGEVFHRSGIAVISNATASQNGRANFRIAFASPNVGMAGRQVTLIAIDSDGNTSEFSARAAYQCDVIFANAYDDGVADVCPSP